MVSVRLLVNPVYLKMDCQLTKLDCRTSFLWMKALIFITDKWRYIYRKMQYFLTNFALSAVYGCKRQLSANFFDHKTNRRVKYVWQDT